MLNNKQKKYTKFFEILIQIGLIILCKVQKWIRFYI